MSENSILEKYPEAQLNESGQVALRCIKEGQFYITGCPSGNEYVATTQAGICLVFVDPQDIEFVMAKKVGCCNNKRRGYFLADETHVNRWLNRGGR